MPQPTDDPDIQSVAAVSAIPLITGPLRIVLGVIGALLEKQGVTSGDQWAQVSGAILFIAPVAWSIWQNYRSQIHGHDAVKAAAVTGEAVAPKVAA